MPAQVKWSEESDACLKQLREVGTTWDGIALAMGLGRNTVLERGRRIGVRRLPPGPPPEPEESRDRPARQAGHPQTWGLLTLGTLLEGEAYPYPVFL
jgi:hypothetical protein